MNPADRPIEPYRGRFDISHRREEIEQAERAVLQEVERRDYSRASVFAIRLAMEEALSNAFKHGNCGDQRKSVRMECLVDRDDVVIEVQDEGEGFDPACVPDPTEAENIELPCGRGLKLMQAFMTEVQVLPPGNKVRLRYVRPRE